MVAAWQVTTEGLGLGWAALTLLGRICPTHNQKTALEPRLSGGLYPSPRWDAADTPQLFSHQYSSFIPRETFVPDSQNLRRLLV